MNLAELSDEQRLEMVEKAAPVEDSPASGAAANQMLTIEHDESNGAMRIRFYESTDDGVLTHKYTTWMSPEHAMSFGNKVYWTAKAMRDADR